MTSMAHKPSEHFRVEVIDGITVITFLESEIKEDIRDRFREIADQLGATAEPKQVVVDFANVRRFQSMVLAILIDFQKRIKDQGGSLKLSGLGSGAITVFKLTRTEGLFDVHPTADDAIKAFQQSKGSWLGRLFGS
jgi:anti-sigma B factor antagonist